MTQEEEMAQKTSEATIKLLKARGWCFWKCDNLNGDIITIYRDGFIPSEDEEKDIMDHLGEIYTHTKKKKKDWVGTIYTEKELILMADSSNIKTVHEAKKLGATFLAQEGAK